MIKSPAFLSFLVTMLLLCCTQAIMAQDEPGHQKKTEVTKRLSIQPKLSEEEAFEKAYQKRISKEYLFGVYIPKDLTDVFIQLNKLIEDKTKGAFKALPEKHAAEKLHFGFGRWMIHNWGFYEGSRLSHFLNELGIYNPDDMASFLIVTYHRNLNKQTLDVKPLIESIVEKRAAAEKDRKLQGEIIHEEKRKVKN